MHKNVAFLHSHAHSDRGPFAIDQFGLFILFDIIDSFEKWNEHAANRNAQLPSDDGILQTLFAFCDCN